MDIYTPFINDPEQLRLLESTMTGRLEYTLMNDFLSKYSLQKDLFALRGLLAALLGKDVEEITSIQVLNPIEPGHTMGDKDCVLDIKLELNKSSIINIEIQARHQEFWTERSLTYLCRNFDHLESGASYNSIKPCIQIGILENDIFSLDDPRYTGEFYSEYRILNTRTHTEYSSKFELRMLLLNHLEDVEPEERENSNGLYHWASLFKAKTWEELRMIAEDNPMMKSFVGTVRKLTAEEEVAQTCEARRRHSNDIATYEQIIEDRVHQLEQKDAQLEQKDAQLEQKDAQLEQKDAQLEQSKHLIDQQAHQISDMAGEIEALKRELAKHK